MIRYLFITSLIFMGSACDSMVFEKGNGQIESQKLTVDSFEEIRLAGNYEISLKQGSLEQVVIVTDENLIPFINVEVENGVLIIEDKEKIRSEDGIKIFITYHHLSNLRSAGASVIKTDNKITSDVFSLEVPGAGLVDIEVEVKDLEVILAGAGLVKLRGSADRQTISLNGVGSLEGFDLESNFCEVTVSGVGGAEVNVKENLNASVKGIGGIKYKGEPKIINDQISGIGTIKKVDRHDEET